MVINFKGRLILLIWFVVVITRRAIQDIRFFIFVVVMVLIIIWMIVVVDVVVVVVVVVVIFWLLWRVSLISFCCNALAIFWSIQSNYMLLTCGNGPTCYFQNYCEMFWSGYEYCYYWTHIQDDGLNFFGFDDCYRIHGFSCWMEDRLLLDPCSMFLTDWGC